MTDNIKQFPRKAPAAPVLPEAIQHTEGYLMQNILYSDQPMKEVDDFVTGTKRNRRWGMVLSFAAIPGFDQVPVNQGPTLLPTTPSRFFTADSIEELRARVMYEVDKALEMAKLAIEDPELFTKKSMESAAQIREQFAQQGHISDIDMS